MAKRWPCPEGVATIARGTATGIVKQRGHSIYSPLIKADMCRVTLEIGEWDMDCVGVGELAERLSCVDAGKAISIDGPLRCSSGVSEITIEDLAVL
jgi:hypothetical protein